LKNNKQHDVIPTIHQTPSCDPALLVGEVETILVGNAGQFNVGVAQIGWLFESQQRDVVRVTKVRVRNPLRVLQHIASTIMRFVQLCHESQVCRSRPINTRVPNEGSDRTHADSFSQKHCLLPKTYTEMLPGIARHILMQRCGVNSLSIGVATIPWQRFP